MTPIQREARRRYLAARAHRRVLEETVLESWLDDDWSTLDRAALRRELGQSRIREAFAAMSARSLGVAA